MPEKRCTHCWKSMGMCIFSLTPPLTPPNANDIINNWSISWLHDNGSSSTFVVCSFQKVNSRSIDTRLRPPLTSCTCTNGQLLAVTRWRHELSSVFSLRRHHATMAQLIFMCMESINDVHLAIFSALDSRISNTSCSIIRDIGHARNMIYISHVVTEQTKCMDVTYDRQRCSAHYFAKYNQRQMK